MPDVQVSMFQGILNRDPRRRVKCQHFVQQVQSVRVGLREEPLEWHFGHEREVAHVFLRSRGSYSRQGLFAGGSKVVKDLIELVHVVATFEEGSTAEQLGEDTSNGPNVNFDWLVVF